MLANVRLVVTGAAAGIGAATAEIASGMGARVVGLDNTTPSDSPAVGRRGSVRYDYIDVGDEQSVAMAFAEAGRRLGGLDAVIHCAGIMRGQRLSIADTPLDLWHEVIGVNLTGTFLVAREAARVMAPQGHGVLLLVASRAGITEPSGSISYGASKGGVHGLGLTLARELKPKGVRVHVVMPGNVDTPLMRASLDEALANGADPRLVEQLRGELTNPAEVGRALALLASDDAGSLTGTVATL